MAEIIQDLLTFCGLDYSPATFGELIPWFVGVCMAVGMLVNVVNGILYACRRIGGK